MLADFATTLESGRNALTLDALACHAKGTLPSRRAFTYHRATCSYSVWAASLMHHYSVVRNLWFMVKPMELNEDVPKRVDRDFILWELKGLTAVSKK